MAHWNGGPSVSPRTLGPFPEPARPGTGSGSARYHGPDPSSPRLGALERRPRFCWEGWAVFIQMPAKGGGPYLRDFCAMSSASISSWLARPLKLRAMFANSVARFWEIPGSLARALWWSANSRHCAGVRPLIISSASPDRSGGSAKLPVTDGCRWLGGDTHDVSGSAFLSITRTGDWSLSLLRRE